MSNSESNQNSGLEVNSWAWSTKFVDLFATYGGWIIGLSVLFHFLLLWYATKPITGWGNYSLDNMAQLGDAFGMLTATFTALAVWIAVVLIKQNRVEMEKARFLIEKQLQQSQKDLDQAVQQSYIDRVNIQPEIRNIDSRLISIDKSDYLFKIILPLDQRYAFRPRLVDKNRKMSGRISLLSLIYEPEDNEASSYEIIKQYADKKDDQEVKFSLHLVYEDMSSLAVSREFVVMFDPKTNEVNIKPYGIVYHNIKVPADDDDWGHLYERLSSKHAKFFKRESAEMQNWRGFR